MFDSKFLEGLLKQPDEGISVQLATWDNMTLASIVANKVTERLRRDSPLSRRIEEDALRWRQSDTCEMRLQMLLRLAKHLELKLPVKANLKDLDDLGGRVEASAVEALKRSDRNFAGSTVPDMVQHTVSQMFAGLSKSFAEQDAQSQDALVDDILGAIEKMPEEQRERLRKELGVDELSQETIRRAIRSGSLGTAFTSLMYVFGMSAVATTLHLLAALAAFLGLPFWLYVNVAVLMSMMSPLVMAGGGVLLGSKLKRKADREIKDGLTPFLVSQVILSATLDTPTPQALVEKFLLACRLSDLKASDARIWRPR